MAFGKIIIFICAISSDFDEGNQDDQLLRFYPKVILSGWSTSHKHRLINSQSATK